MTAKLLLMSVVILIIAAPVVAARNPNPRRSLKRTIILLFGYNLFYFIVIRYIYPHFQ